MKKHLFCLLAIVFVAFGCKKTEEPTPPSAEFSIQYLTTKLPDRAPIAIQVTAKEDGASYQWSAVGVTSGAGKTITITFSSGGTKEITLSCTKNGITRTSSQSILVKKPYSKARIKKVRLNTFPATKPSSGASWDNLSAPDNLPDIYYEITSGNTIVTSGANANNVATGQTPQWTYTTPFQVPAAYMLVPLSVTFWEDDSPWNQTVSELMGTSTMVALNSCISTDASVRYPDSITLTGSNNINATVDWEWAE